MQPWRRTDWTLEDWTRHAWYLEHLPRCSQRHYDACTRHVQKFPGDLVAVEPDRALLRSLRDLMRQGHPNRFGRPSRGYRAGHWTTPALVDVQNQLARLDRFAGRNAPD